MAAGSGALAKGLGRAGGVPVGLLAFVVVCRLLVVGDGLGRHGRWGEGEGPMQPSSPSGAIRPGTHRSPLPRLCWCPVLLSWSQRTGRGSPPRPLAGPHLPLTFSMSTSSVS